VSGAFTGGALLSAGVVLSSRSVEPVPGGASSWLVLREAVPLFSRAALATHADPGPTTIFIGLGPLRIPTPRFFVARVTEGPEQSISLTGRHGVVDHLGHQHGCDRLRHGWLGDDARRYPIVVLVFAVRGIKTQTLFGRGSRPPCTGLGSKLRRRRVSIDFAWLLL
jgi:hypothetical protein